MLVEVIVPHVDSSAGCWKSPFTEEHCLYAIVAYSPLRQPKLSLKEHDLLRKIIFKRNSSPSMTPTLISDRNEVKTTVDILLH